MGESIIKRFWAAKRQSRLAGIIFRSCFAGGLVLFAQATFAQLNESENKALNDALFISNANQDSLKYARINPNDKQTLALVAGILNDPILGIGTLSSIHQKAGRPISQMLLTARRDLLGDGADTPPAPIFLDDQAPEQVPAEFRASLQRLAGAIQAANNSIRAALSRLSDPEQRQLIESLPQWAAGDDAKFDFVKQKPLPLREIEAMIAKIDLAAIRRAAESLAAVVERETSTLKQAASSSLFLGKIEGRLGGVPFVFAGKGDDIHNERNAMLTIDIGGNDRYIGRHGAGIGYASIFIDLEGDDTYDVPDASLGAGLLGIGLAYDLGGKDTCRSKNIAFGAGLAGVGAWYKSGGDDDYRGGDLVQGYGFYGIGISEDTGGDDTYIAHAHAQGFAQTRGLGWLIDDSGDDTYRATAQQSFSQGSSSGFYGSAPESSGGLGLLTDLKGVDQYQAGDMSQGCGVARSVGSLYDGNGNDTYSGGSWCQGAGDRGGAGFLLEQSGDDLYGSVAASCAFAGEESDGVLVDHSGADRYVSLSPSIVTAYPSGTAILLDGGGVDVFGAATGATVGSGIAITVDLGSAYRSSNEFGSTKAAYGSGAARLSVPGGPPEPDLALLPKITAQPNSLPMPLTAELELIFGRATLPIKPENLTTIGEARNRLVGIGVSAVKWMVEQKLAKSTESERDVIGLIAKTCGTDATNLVALAINSSDDATAIAALQISGSYGFADAGSLLKSALERPALQIIAIQTGRQLHAANIAPDLMILTASQDRWLARHAAEALSEIADVGSIGTAQVLLTAPEWPIRAAGFRLLAQNPAQAYSLARAMSGSGIEKEARLGMELLGRIGSTEALNDAVRGLKDSRPGVRLSAMLALNGRFPKEALPQLADLREDSDTRVRLVAQSIEIGR